MAAHAATPHGVGASLVRFGRLWLALFALAVAAAVGGNLIAHVPLTAVVDVVLASTVFVMAALLLFELFQAAASLIRGHSGAALGRALLALTVLVLPAAPVLAFDGYAWLRHEPLWGASDVYDAVIGSLATGVAWPAQLLSEAVAFCFGQHGYVSYVGQTKSVLETIYYGLGILAALHALRTNTRHGLEPM
jgi:hypothetical protein